MTELNLHPACAAFPVMPPNELAELAADIKVRGLIEPVTLMPDGAILDGRCRWLACQQAGAEPKITVYDGDDPIGFVVSKNKHRRHQTKSQLAMILARLSKLQHGSNQYQKKEECVSNTLHSSTLNELAAKGDLNKSTVRYARDVLNNAEPHVVAMADAGAVSVRTAAEAIRATPRAEQANWTVADVKAKGREVINAYPCNRGSKENLPAPRRSRQPIDRSAIFDSKRLKLKPLSPEESGRPVGAAALEQDPDWPIGWTRGQTHIEKHGRVQTTTPEEQERRRLYDRFMELNGTLRPLAIGEWPSKADLDKLDNRRRDVIIKQWQKFGPKLLDVLDMIQSAAGRRRHE